jgi:predicted nuclease of predicted toxin-antitoxin system
MTKILLDQGLPRLAAELLRQQGWDALHVGEVGLATASDQTILKHAELQGRTVVTLDADFHALLAVSGASAPSVVRLRIEGLKGSELAVLLVRVWERAGSALTRGAIATVTPGSIRIKELPIGQKLTQD